MTKEFAFVGCSVSGVTAYTLETLIEASDGNTYRVAVTYDEKSGIPLEGAQLAVREVLPDTDEYTFYRNESMAAMGTDDAHLAFTRVFDIKIVDAADPTRVYEPQNDVQVSITLVGEALANYADLSVLHFAESGAKAAPAADRLDADLSGDTLTFTTDSFSVYAVNGQNYVRYLYYFTVDRYEQYYQYGFTVEGQEEPVRVQIVRDGERAVAPQDPVNPADVEASFDGWYYTTNASIPMLLLLIRGPLVTATSSPRATISRRSCCRSPRRIW